LVLPQNLSTQKVGDGGIYSRADSSSPPPAPTYPLEGVTGVYEGYSFRQLISTATSALRARNINTNVETDVGFLPNGSFDEATFAGLGSIGDMRLVTLYGQVNGIDLTQSTAAIQPGFTTEGGKTVVNVTFNEYLVFPAQFTLTGSALMGTYKNISTSVQRNVIISDIADYVSYYIGSNLTTKVGASGNISTNYGSNSNSTAWAQYSLSQADWVRRDGADLSLDSSDSIALVNIIWWGNGGGVGGDFTSGETVIFSTKPSNGVRGTLESSMRTYWGTP
jgi:hypothetical protein